MSTKIKKLAIAHPYAVLFIICLCCAIFNPLEKGHTYLPGLIIMFIVQSVIIVFGCIYSRKYFSIIEYLGFTFILLIIAFYLDYNYLTLEDPIEMIAAAGIVFTIGLGFIWALQKKLTTKRIILLLFILGFTIRLVYIIETGWGDRQHDFGGNNGHLNYIEFFYKYNFTALPPVDTENVNQFYHPPFYYAIAALWFKIQNLIIGAPGAEISELAKENLQLLTLFFSSTCMIISYKIFNSFKMSSKGLIASTAIVAFHPTFIILSGSINNDILSIMFFLAAILCTIQWYKNPTLINILKIAFAVGFGMMTKLSVALVAPAIALLFIIKFFKSKTYFKFIKQFSAFTTVVVPLGLWWGIRNFFYNNVPLTYIPKIKTEGHSQYLGQYSIWQRLFDFSSADVWMARGSYYGYEYREHNLALMILKTSLFGEYYIGKSQTHTYYFSNVLFFANLIICIIAVLAIIYFIFKKTEIVSNAFRVFFGVLYVTIMGSYIKFCFDFPHDCTMDFRYIVPTVIIGAFFIGLSMPGEKIKPQKWYNAFLTVLIFIFCISSMFLYITL
ncbi:MAG: hypothetical protein A2Y17_13635 [Clostridiales bacterium GWF2_38_85]|nr:MAG: hypothetical protein A2Y17_13635 [Clostridiales bacterium GWF2_38_85]